METSMVIFQEHWCKERALCCCQVTDDCGTLHQIMFEGTLLICLWIASKLFILEAFSLPSPHPTIKSFSVKIFSVHNWFQQCRLESRTAVFGGHLQNGQLVGNLSSMSTQNGQLQQNEEGSKTQNIVGFSTNASWPTEILQQFCLVEDASCVFSLDIFVVIEFWLDDRREANFKEDVDLGWIEKQKELHLQMKQTTNVEPLVGNAILNLNQAFRSILSTSRGIELKSIAIMLNLSNLGQVRLGALNAVGCPTGKGCWDMQERFARMIL